jgi:hypothetical protein
METTRKWLFQIGTIILCVNAGLSFMYGPAKGPAQLVFRIGVFLLGLALLAAGCVLWLVDRSRSTKSGQSEPEEVHESEVFD